MKNKYKLERKDDANGNIHLQSSQLTYRQDNKLTIFLVDRTAHSMIDYWQGRPLYCRLSVCLSVRPFVCDAVHCG